MILENTSSFVFLAKFEILSEDIITLGTVTREVATCGSLEDICKTYMHEILDNLEMASVCC